MAKQATARAEIPAAPAVHTPSKAQFVTVASKLPMNVQLQLCKLTEKQVPGRYGSETEKYNLPYGPIAIIRGTAYPKGTPPKGFPKRPGMIEDDTYEGGYALTPKIPKEWFDEWLEQNRDTDMVRNGLIKAQPDLDSLASDAAEHAKVDSGLGSINPEMDEKGRPLDARAPQPLNPQVQHVSGFQPNG